MCECIWHDCVACGSIGLKSQTNWIFPSELALQVNTFSIITADCCNFNGFKVHDIELIEVNLIFGLCLVLHTG